MAIFQQDDVELYYEVHGDGFPILLIAPGGMLSAVPFWETTPWNPIEQLSSSYRVIAMDQRNAGRSRAPIEGTDGWHVYIRDQLNLMDHLGVEQFHVVGMCIGGPYSMGLIEAAPERVASVVLFQSIGLDENRPAFYDMFDSWAGGLKAQHGEVSEAAWNSFRSAMFDGDFLFNVSREFVADCRTPLLVLCGKDHYHPEEISRAIAALAPNATFIENWQEPEHRSSAQAAVASFLAENTPG